MTARFLKRKIGSGTTRIQISPRTLSVALLVCSIVWLLAACACYVPSAPNVDWSTTPLLWPLILMVTPSICFSIGFLLLNTRQQLPLSGLERCALVAAFFPVTLGTLWTIWAVKTLFWASFQDASTALKTFGALASLALAAISSTMIWKTARLHMGLRRI